MPTAGRPLGRRSKPSLNKKKGFYNKSWGQAYCLTPTFVIEPHLYDLDLDDVVGASIIDGIDEGACFVSGQDYQPHLKGFTGSQGK